MTIEDGRGDEVQQARTTFATNMHYCSKALTARTTHSTRIHSSSRSLHPTPPASHQRLGPDRARRGRGRGRGGQGEDDDGEMMMVITYKIQNQSSS